MRSYKTVREVLERISSWHRELLDFCSEEQGDDDPLRPLVEYLSSHERDARRVLDRFEPRERETILNTWLQYVPAEPVEAVLVRAANCTDLTSEDQTALILAFDDALADFYKSIADQSQAPPRVNDVFRSLLEMQQHQALRNAWSIRESDSFLTGRG
jgi:hypothetical protein